MGKKLTYEEVKSYIEKFEGYKLISEEYINSDTKLKIKHLNCSTEYEVRLYNFKTGTRCPICSVKKVQEKLKFTYEEVKSYIEKFEGYKLISEEYINNSKKLTIKHLDCSNKYEVRFRDFKNKNIRCPFCAGKKRSKSLTKITIEFIKEYCASLGYICLSDEYKGQHFHLDLICNNGHECKITWNNFKHGYLCIHCFNERRKKYTEENYKQYKEYKEVVDRITNKNFKDYYYTINPLRMARRYKDYHLDHKFSIMDGFINNIDPKIIANPYNLQMLWWKDNISKHKKSCINKEKLYLDYNKFLIEIHKQNENTQTV